MGTIMSVFMQEQHGHEQERAEEDSRVFMNVNGAVPEVKSPIPQKVSQSKFQVGLGKCLNAAALFFSY